MTDEKYTADKLRDDALSAIREAWEYAAKDNLDSDGEGIADAIRDNGGGHEAAGAAVPVYYSELQELASDPDIYFHELSDPGLIPPDADLNQQISARAYDVAHQAIAEELQSLADAWDEARSAAEYPASWQEWTEGRETLSDMAQAQYNQVAKTYPYSADECPPGMMRADIEDHAGGYLITDKNGRTLFLQGDDVGTLDEEIRATLGHEYPTDCDFIPEAYADLFTDEENETP